MPRVELVHWNPARPVLPGTLGRILPIRRRINNFGDLLGPIVVGKLLQLLGLASSDAVRSTRLLTIGSVLSLAKDGDTIWGTGVNGKSLTKQYRAMGLDIRAVRGPLTHRFLVDQGARVPAVFGDPGLLIGRLWSREELRGAEPSRALTVIPNLNDLPHYERTGAVVDPRTDVWTCLRKIAAADFVTGSSLHAIVVADSLGIPARLIQSEAEPNFKYDDYYRGSGRSGFTPARNVEHALALGGEPPLDWDAEPLLKAFPCDLWGGDEKLPQVPASLLAEPRQPPAGSL